MRRLDFDWVQGTHFGRVCGLGFVTVSFLAGGFYRRLSFLLRISWRSDFGLWH